MSGIRETFYVNLESLMLGSPTKVRIQRGTSEILEESIEIMDIRPLHISVVCFLPEPSRAVPKIFGK